MTDNSFARDGKGQIDRRNLLKLAGGTAGGSLAVTAVGSARNDNAGDRGNGGGKSGGRGHTSDDILKNEPFTVSHKKVITTNASCMSGNSAQQEYNRYNYEYCNVDHPSDTICVIPDDSKVDEDRVYEFQSKQKCKDPDRSEGRNFQYKFSFGPSNSDCE